MTILVTGATGNLGRLVVERLHEDGHTVRALTRDASARAAAGLPEGVEVVEGDLTHPDTLSAALDGVTALHLLGSTGHDHTPLAAPSDLLNLAAGAGVRRLTVLAPGDDAWEKSLRASTLAWTLVWPIDFMPNTLGWADVIRTQGEVREPYASRRTASVDERDAAEVIATVLTRGGHTGERLVMTGPQALTPTDKVAVLATATGQDLRFTELTDDEARAQWRAEGRPEEGIDFMLHMWATVPASVSRTTSTVTDILGRPPRPFTDWATTHAAAFRP
ncbi:nucleotide-diphosphate-sugar epimerase [Streptomyces spiroverticillatus]|uniref:Nucleotide-diphosphate-sugar epimerase n=1 Tax=Streptomyces finlayi TaxID=67296 RepID=A0A918X1H3_9ACTN|nr:NAD(P)H-binding protein [Streptomyces finlayi]GHA20166.1 nucleotide-diphosphate-sugar epimerase [Streptomyces spiroverticillatus]GHD02981.1 nucleotide-diphosphate-sugar epimerase [Streptomyces finlayi]